MLYHPASIAAATHTLLVSYSANQRAVLVEILNFLLEVTANECFPYRCSILARREATLLFCEIASTGLGVAPIGPQSAHNADRLSSSFAFSPCPSGLLIPPLWFTLAGVAPQACGEDARLDDASLDDEPDEVLKRIAQKV